MISVVDTAHRRCLQGVNASDFRVVGVGAFRGVMTLRSGQLAVLGPLNVLWELIAIGVVPVT